MKFPHSILFVSVASLLSGCVIVANPSYADVHIQKELTLHASQLKQLMVEAGAGNLVVTGSATTEQIHVSADIYTEKSHQDNYRFELSQSGQSASLVAKMNSTSGFWHGDSPHIDIRITMPNHLLLAIEDGSGDIEIENIDAAIEINDGSGGISIEHVKGNVTIEDGSGELQLKHIQGDVNIDDGSGSITVRNIAGDTFIEDGSGDLTVRDVTGTVTIDDGSGSIDIERAGNVTILESGSGGLRVKEVSGNFEIND